jgi:hypothetical protein
MPHERGKDVRVVIARYVSYWITRTPMTDAPFHLTILVHNEDQTALLDRKPSSIHCGQP